jgi:hypothetical protein
MISLYRDPVKIQRWLFVFQTDRELQHLIFLGLAEKIARPFVLDSEGNRESVLGFDPVLS